jgi:hypothetical protein
MTNKKYKLLTDGIKTIGVKTLYRIQALIGIKVRDIKKGDLGGYIEEELNLDNNSKVYNNSAVNNSKVENSMVYHSTVKNNSTIKNSTVKNNSTIKNSTVKNNSTIKNSTVEK